MGSLTQREDDELRIAERAAQWQSVLDHAGANEREEFMAWLQESPRHVREFLLMQAMDLEAAGIDPEKQIDIDELLARVPSNVAALRHPGASRGPVREDLVSLDPGLRRDDRRVWRWVATAAALVAVALVLLWGLSPEFLGASQRYATNIGEQRSVELPDGSLIQLNTQSRVHVDFSDNARDVRLVEGEALFKVAHDAARPFSVHIDHTIVRALGTQFNIYRRASGAMVSVLEGRVAISAEASPAAPVRELAAGEAVRVTPAGKVASTSLDTAEATAWRQRRLIFRETALGEIAAEFNRYNRTPQLLVEGDAVRARRYGGIFDADDPESFVSYLAQDARLTFDKKSGTLIIRER